MKHRNIDFDVEEIEPSKWQWKIYPKMEAGPKVVGETLLESRDAAIAALSLRSTMVSMTHLERRGAFTLACIAALRVWGAKLN